MEGLRGRTCAGGGSFRKIFFGVVRKILRAKGLRARDRGISGQNIEPQGLTAKIFWNKGLALCAEPLRGSLAENGVEDLSRMLPSLRFPESSVKVVRHRSGEFFCGRLWKRLVSSGSGTAADWLSLEKLVAV